MIRGGRGSRAGRGDAAAVSALSAASFFVQPRTQGRSARTPLSCASMLSSVAASLRLRPLTYSDGPGGRARPRGGRRSGAAHAAGGRSGGAAAPHPGAQRACSLCAPAIACGYAAARAPCKWHNPPSLRKAPPSGRALTGLGILEHCPVAGRRQDVFDGFGVLGRFPGGLQRLHDCYACMHTTGRARFKRGGRQLRTAAAVGRAPGASRARMAAAKPESPAHAPCSRHARHTKDETNMHEVYRCRGRRSHARMQRKRAHAAHGARASRSIWRRKGFKIARQPPARAPLSLTISSVGLYVCPCAAVGRARRFKGGTARGGARDRARRGRPA